MTLYERNTFFKLGILFCSLCTLLLVFASFLTIPSYQNIDENFHRPNGIFQGITGFFMENDYYAVHSSLILSVLFSFIGIILIFYFFERTSAPEILYIAFFTISLSFEVIRLILPMHFIYNFPSVYVRIAFKILFFARYFGIFSLFAASICAAGLDVQKTRNVIFAIFIAVLLIIFGVPIDVLSWDTSLNMVNGFSSTFKMIELTVYLTAMISFFIAAKTRDSKEYIYVAIGMILALFGRNILLNTDNWISPVFGILLLSFGTLFLCSKLHRIHLWL